MILKLVIMGCTGTRDFSFLAFFQFLVSRREIGDEKREIDFLNFLPNFSHFWANIGLFWWLFKVLQCFKRHRQLIAVLRNIAYFVSKKSQLPSSSVRILPPEELYRGGFSTIFRVGFFLVFFLVSREKWLKISRFWREIKMREKCNP